MPAYPPLLLSVPFDVCSKLPSYHPPLQGSTATKAELSALYAPIQAAIGRANSVVLVGGGPTAVETAGALCLRFASDEYEGPPSLAVTLQERSSLPGHRHL